MRIYAPALLSALLLTGCAPAGLLAERAEISLRETFEPVPFEWRLDAPAYGASVAQYSLPSPAPLGAIESVDSNACWLPAAPDPKLESDPCLAPQALALNKPLRWDKNLPAPYFVYARRERLAGPYVSHIHYRLAQRPWSFAAFPVADLMAGRRLANSRLALYYLDPHSSPEGAKKRDLLLAQLGMPSALLDRGPVALLTYQAPDLSQKRMADLGESPRYGLLPAVALASIPMPLGPAVDMP